MKKKSTTVPFLSAFLILVLVIVNAWILALPVKAADCTAKCANGGYVQCSGHTCKALDGVGCKAFDTRGREIIEIPCSGF